MVLSEGEPRGATACFSLSIDHRDKSKSTGKMDKEIKDIVENMEKKSDLDKVRHLTENHVKR